MTAIITDVNQAEPPMLGILSAMHKVIHGTNEEQCNRLMGWMNDEISVRVSLS